MDERPLHVQLNWNKDDREGRFLLRNLDEKPWVRYDAAPPPPLNELALVSGILRKN